MNLLNEECLNCVYGDGKPLTCNKYGGMLRGGFCFPCNLEAENSYNGYQDAYSFNDPSYNSNYLPQPQYVNYLCNLCGNNSHDGYDCQQHFSFIYEQEPIYNQNYNDNYYPYASPSFPCCDNRGGSHETFQCQPMAQNIDFSGSDQIQTPQYHDVNSPSQETNLKELAEYKESLDNSSKEIVVSNSNEEKEESSQDSDMHQLIEECCTEVSEEQKQSMEDTMLELVKICQEKEFLCIHDNVDDLIEIATILSTKEPEHSSSMGEYEVTSEDESKCDVPISKNSSICDDHFDIFSDSKINDDISVYDDDFEDIEYVEALLSDPEIVSGVKEENDVHQEEEEIYLEDISQIQDIVLHEKLLSITRLISNIESLNDNPTPDREPIYNQNYNDNYYAYASPSFPCCDNRGGSHETFQCQPMAQNIDFSGSDQIQTPQYPDVNSSSQETSEEVSQAKEDLIKSIQTFLEKFDCIPFEERPKIYLQTWYNFLKFRHAKPEDSNELFQKLLEDLKELAEYKESLDNSSKEIAVSNSNEEKEESSQDSDMHQLIEECCTKVSEEQKQSMEDTMLELVKICQEKEFLCIHDNVDDLIESALNSKLLLINSNSQRLDKKQQEVKNVVKQPAEHGSRIESLQNFRVIHKSSISFKNTSQISSIHAVATILSTKEHEHSSSMGEYEVTSEDESKCDVRISKNSSICDDHFDIFSDSKINDDISVYDDDFEDIEYVEALLSDPEIVSGVEEENDEENDVHQEEEEIDLEDISQIQDIVLQETRSGNTTHADNALPEYDSFCFEIEPDQERLINLVKNNIFDDSSNDPILEEANLFLASDNSIPSGIENSADDSEGDILFVESPIEIFCSICSP
nr:hypothetical protein [Tanacetum cinerariifolium]